MLANRPIALRLQLLSLAAVLSLMLLGGYQAVDTMRTMEIDRKAMLEEAVQSAIAITRQMAQAERDQRLSHAEAQARAIDAIRAMRYRGSEYLWINDMAARIVMHPIRPDLEGKDASGMVDPNGVHLFVAFADKVRAKGHGFVTYMWPRPGSTAPIEKLSYVEGFAPWGWVIGSGVYMDDLRSAEHSVLWRGTMIVGGIAAVLVTLALLIARGIVRPLHDATRATAKVASGDYATEIPHTGRGDEIGLLARALETFRRQGRDKAALEAAAAAARATRERRQAALEGHTADFGASMSGVMRSLASAGEAMRSTAEEVATAAEQTRGATADGARGADMSCESLATVAAAAEELSASVNEISRQVSHAAAATRDAVEAAGTARQGIGGLAREADEISAVVQTISEIAGRTNLLALNATIEAARAGDAGKGFGVVAVEVKHLAEQTAQATDSIRRQIANLQAEVTRNVTAVQDVTAAIENVSGVSAAIASAVEEQGAATREIAERVQSVAVQTRQASDMLQLVSRVAESTSGLSRDVLAAAGDVSTVSTTLHQEVDDFLTAMRNDTGDRRRYERVVCGGESVAIGMADGAIRRAKLQDISQSGAAIDVADVTAKPGDPVTLRLHPDSAPVEARVARLLRGGLAVVFRQDAATAQAVDAAIARLHSTAGHKAA